MILSQALGLVTGCASCFFMKHKFNCECACVCACFPLILWLLFVNFGGRCVSLWIIDAHK